MGETHCYASINNDAIRNARCAVREKRESLYRRRLFEVMSNGRGESLCGEGEGSGLRLTNERGRRAGLAAVGSVVGKPRSTSFRCAGGEHVRVKRDVDVAVGEEENTG